MCMPCTAQTDIGPLWPVSGCPGPGPGAGPPQALVSKVVSYGTYVVAKPHPLSDSPDIEWRLSFSRGEVDLMRSVTLKQRKAFRLAKRLCKLHFEDSSKCFCSYFIKTCFMWMVEGSPPSLWDTNMTHIVIKLLHRITECFIRGDLPNYFIRSCNMINHLTRDDRMGVVRTLNVIRLSIVGYDPQLPPEVLEDYCLFLINTKTEPTDDSSILPILQHEML